MPENNERLGISNVRWAYRIGEMLKGIINGKFFLRWIVAVLLFVVVLAFLNMKTPQSQLPLPQS